MSSTTQKLMEKGLAAGAPPFLKKFLQKTITPA